MSSPTFDHETFLSPLTWRYGSPEMRRLFSEAERRRIWRRIWLAVAEAQADAGVVPTSAVAALGPWVDRVDIARAEAIEAEIQHDLMAELRTVAEQCPEAGGWLHLGCTSMDIEDNADALRLRDALALVLGRLEALMTALAERIDATADDATMAFTHLQPAEPTTTGYRLAQLGWDLLVDHNDLQRLRDGVMGKGLKGAVGTGASFDELLDGHTTTPAVLEAAVMARLGLPAMPVSTQTYARKQDFRVLSGLASLGQSLYRFAADLRLLQSPTIGEWREPFGSKQVGSSAMPFKRNPIHAENIDSLTRMLAALPRVAWDNAAHCYLERTLDDSANRRMLLPGAFLLVDEALRRATRLVREMTIDRRAAEALLDRFGVFAASERVLMELGRAGGDRQALHEMLREHSLQAWEAVRLGAPNPLADQLASDPRLLALADADRIRALLDARAHVGDAPERARAIAAQLRHAAGQGDSDADS
ncbi:MAG: adenylosuccinate lyase [Pseudomonadota bacterium]|jgi:adenylosuccinate lyase